MDDGELSLQGQVAWLSHLADRGHARCQVDGGFAVATGLLSNTDNGVVADPSLLRQPAQLDYLLSWLRSRHVPASLILTEPVTFELAQRLTERGLRAEKHGRAMGKALPTGHHAPVQRGDGWEAEEVTDGRSLRESLSVYLADSWFDDHSELDQDAEVADRLGYGPGRPLRHWMVRHEGVPIGAATSFVFSATVMLMRCCVLSDYRRRGVASALTLAREEAAHAGGATRAVLSPSPDGARLHETLGFSVTATPPDQWFYLT